MTNSLYFTLKKGVKKKFWALLTKFHVLNNKLVGKEKSLSEPFISLLHMIPCISNQWNSIYDKRIEFLIYVHLTIFVIIWFSYFFTLLPSNLCGLVGKIAGSHTAVPSSILGGAKEFLFLLPSVWWILMSFW